MANRHRPQAVTKNESIFPVYMEALRSSDTDKFEARMLKLTGWFTSPKAYYEQSKPWAVKLLETARENIETNYVGPHPNVYTDSGQLELVLKRFYEMAKEIWDYRDKFEGGLRGRLDAVVQAATRLKESGGENVRENASATNDDSVTPTSDEESTISIEDGEIIEEDDTTSTTLTPPTTFSLPASLAIPSKLAPLIAENILPYSPPDPDALIAELDQSNDPAFHQTLEVLRRGSNWPSVSFAELDRHSPVYYNEEPTIWKPALDCGSLGAKWTDTPASRRLLCSFGGDANDWTLTKATPEPVMTPPRKMRKVHGIPTSVRRTEQFQPGSYGLSPPAMSLDELVSEQYASEAPELRTPRFPEDTFILCAPRNTRDDETVFSFTLTSEQYARTQLWAARKNGPVNVDGALCISLGCYRQSTFIELMNLDKHLWKNVNNLTSCMTCEWPMEAAYVQALLPSGWTNIPICLPGIDFVRTPEDCIDITEYARAGTNNFIIFKQGPNGSRDDFCLIVHAHRPTDLQLQQLGKRARVHSGFARLVTDIRTQCSAIPTEYLV